MCHDKKHFPDIYSLLFFLEVISVGRKILYRGQYNGDWDLETTISRKQKEGCDLKAIIKAKKDFVTQVQNLSDATHFCLSDIQEEALCQHYGFPTSYLDFTWKSEIAAFFALGGENRYKHRNIEPHHLTGSIFAFDISNCPSSDIELVSLPQQMMRPTLQYGEFLKLNLPWAKSAKIYKFIFDHRNDLWIEDICNISGNDVTPINSYLMPKRDDVETTAKTVKNQCLPELVEHDLNPFVYKFYNICKSENNTTDIDMELAVLITRGNPKEAQAAIQWFWLKFLQSKDNEEKLRTRWLCCSMYYAYKLASEPNDIGLSIIAATCKGIDEELTKYIEGYNATIEKNDQETKR